MSGTSNCGGDRSASGGVLWRRLCFEWMQSHATFVSAFCASTCSVLVGHPLDNMKTRMQAFPFKNMSDCATNTMKHEGIRGFYRGVATPLMSVAAIRTLSFNVYETSRATLANLLTSTSPSSSTKLTRLAHVEHLTVPQLLVVSGASGSLSGLIIAQIICPLELIKIQLQLQRLSNREAQQRLSASTTITSEIPSPSPSSSTKKPINYTSTLDCAKQIFKKNGIPGFYRGLSLQMLRDGIGTGIYFMSYEGLHVVLSSTGQREGAADWVHFISGGLCGIITWSVVYPIDTLKTNLQKAAMLDHDHQHLQRNHPSSSSSASATSSGVSSPSYLSSFLNKMKSQVGGLGMYSGMRTTLIRSFPIHAVTFLVYEHVHDWLIPPSSSSNDKS